MNAPKSLLLSATILVAATFTTARAQSPTPPEQQADTADSSAPPPAAASPAPLKVSAYPRYFSSYSNPLTRNPAILLRFNAAVDPADLTAHAHLLDEKRRPLPIIASRPTSAQTAPLQSPPPQPTEDNPNPQHIAYPLEHFVRIQPASDLPYDRNWTLVLPTNLASSDQSHQLARPFQLKLGSIRAFATNSIHAVSPYDNTRRIDIHLNKRLAEKLAVDRVAELVHVSPRPDELRISKSSNTIRLHGQFALNKDYRVTIQPGLPAHDRTTIEKEQRSTVRFQPAEPFVSLSAFSAPQLSSGKRTFDINAGNLHSLEVRIKKLDDRDLIYALRGYRAYQEKDRSVPFEMVPGQTVYARSYQAPEDYDHIQSVTLDWREVLQSPPSSEATPAALYISAEGDSRLHRDYREFGAHSIIQLTDIGLAWKRDRSHEHIYTFSLSSGAPLAGVTLHLTDNDARPLRTVTSDAHGLARLPRRAPDPTSGSTEEEAPSEWLLAKLGDDRHVISLDSLGDTIGLWRFNIPYQYNHLRAGSDSLSRRSYIFTDRPVYRPGDEVFMKCHTRLTDFDNLLPSSSDHDSNTTARLRIFDARHRTILDTRVAVSELGSLDHRFTLPEEGLGYFQIELDFNPEGTAENSNDRRYDLVARHHILVAEYRPNTFEITLTAPNIENLDLEKDPVLEIPVAARYFMGKPLSKAQLEYYARFSPWEPQPAGLENFNFRHHDSTSPGSASDQLALESDGSALIVLDAPAADDYPAPLRVIVNGSITDINQQTVAGSTDFVVHTADHYLGILAPDETGREKQAMTLEFAAIDRSGAPLVDRAIPAELTIEKITRHTVKVKGAGGTVTTRNHTRFDPVSRTRIEITTSAVDPDSGKITATAHTFTPKEPGNYRITIASMEPDVRSAASTQVKVIGENDRDWSWRDDVRLTLTPEKETYQPGDTARIFLDSAIRGHALVTIERAHVRHSFTRELTRNRDVLEIPVPKDGAPNLFVSVLVTRGAEDSPHKHRAPNFRLGYTQLIVEDPSTELTIDLETPQSTYQPDDAIDVTATVHDADGQPLPDTEVTLYAVDEGVLSLTGHQTPNPNDTLNAPWDLQIATGQSLGNLHSEDPDELYFGNKGFVIGGGGEGGDGSDANRVRKNFKALAFWRGSLITDRNGRVSASFTAPDNLTEYRLIAVAAHDNRFASADTPLTIHKPLIVEPALPAFANVGDRIDLRAVLHNNTDKPLTLDVRLKLDHTAVFPGLDAPKYIPAGLDDGATATADSRSTRTRRIELAAGETSAITFPVDFKNVGIALWKWSVLSVNDASLSDHVESSLNVGYPLPLLRETHHTSIGIDANDRDANLLKKISPELLRGRGNIRVTASNSRLIEANDALEYLLKYPYGCVEQTTSSTLPWLSTQNLRDALPDLQKTDAEIADAIRSGTRRLLSMQTSDGGLGYWPGADEPILWGSAYGGMALALAQRQGTVDLPVDSLDALWTYLSRQLRKTGEITDAYQLSQRSLVLYTLALAGKSEPAYHDVLFERREELPAEARALLALAILESGGSENSVDPRALALLEEKSHAPDSGVNWYGDAYTHATNLLARTLIDPVSPATDQVITDLLATRKGQNGWGSTYRNAWPFLALTTYTRATMGDLDAGEVNIRFAGKDHPIQLPDRASSATVDLPFDGNLENQTLTLSPKAESGSSTPLHAHIEIETLPDLQTTQPVAKDGYAISRSYRRIAADGTLSPADELNIGDLVLITLDLTIPDKQHYIAIDDPLPAIFEAINPEFKTQANQNAPQTGDWRKRLYTHYKELRKDRALFFCDYLYRAGDYQIQYLARVTATGEATAPAAKIEAMYSPQSYALSTTERVAAAPLVPDADGEANERSKVAIR